MSKPKEAEIKDILTTEDDVLARIQAAEERARIAEERAAKLEAEKHLPDVAAPKESAAEISARLDQQRFMVFLPSTGIKDEDTVPVIINGICTLIPKGKRVAVTRPVYEVLMRSEDAHMQTVRFDKEKENIDRTRERW